MNAFGWLRFRFWSRLISCGLVLSMLSYEMLWANPSSFGAAVKSPVYSFRDSSAGPREDNIPSYPAINSPIIYHIQDAHAVFAAQQNLSELLESLIRKEGINLVLVEGGSGNLNLTPLRRTAWKKVRNRVGADFLRQGKITGEEFLQLSTNYSFDLYGIEGPVLYRKNLTVFLDSQSKREAISKALGQLESAFHAMEAAIYPAKFRMRDLSARKWRSGVGDLTAYLNLLNKTAASLNISFGETDLERLKQKGSVDGRKLFLTALLHRAVRVRLLERLRIAAVKLLRDLGESPGSMARAYFIPDNRSTLGLEFLAQIERANKLLSSMA